MYVTLLCVARSCSIHKAATLALSQYPTLDRSLLRCASRGVPLWGLVPGEWWVPIGKHTVTDGFDNITETWCNDDWILIETYHRNKTFYSFYTQLLQVHSH